MSSPTLWVLVPAITLLVGGGVILWPRTGLLALWSRMCEVRRRVLAEDALKHLHSREWGGRPATPDSLAGTLRVSPLRATNLVAQMEARGWLRASGDGLRLTPTGERLALQVVRAHRLWERYLVDEARMPLVDVHAEAERREHVHSADVLDAFDAAMGYPSTDPHGDPIPTASGELARVSAKPVTDWPLKSAARIVHIEDEPVAIFAQIDAEGFHPGQTIRVVEADTRRIVISDGQETHVVAPVVAANIFVGPPVADGERPGARPLTALHPGQRATVCRLDEALQGFTRRRLLDLGLTPGTAVGAEMSSFAGDPMAYRVRGSLIALRREQAKHVFVDIDRDQEPRP